MSGFTKVLGFALSTFLAATMASHTHATDVEVYTFVLDQSGSMNTIRSEDNKSRWQHALDQATRQAQIYAGIIGPTPNKRAYVRFLKFDSYNAYSHIMPLEELYSIPTGDIWSTSQYVIDQLDTYKAESPRNLTALADALCKSMVDLGNITEQQLTTMLTDRGLTPPNNPVIVDREMFFYTDLYENASTGECKPSSAGDWSHVVDKAEEIQAAHPNDKFNFHLYLLNPPQHISNALAFSLSNPGVTNNDIEASKRASKSLSSSKGLASAVIPEQQAILRMAEILNGHVHVAHDNEETIVYSGHANCYKDGIYICLQ